MNLDLDVKAPFEREIVVPGESFPNLSDVKLLAVDVETKPAPDHVRTKKAGLHPWRAELLGVAVAVPGRAWYVPLRHRAPGSERFNVDHDATMRWLGDALRRCEVLINQNLKFDLKMLAVAGGLPVLELLADSFLYCTWVGTNLVDEREPVQSLKPLCDKLLGIPAAEEVLKNRYLKEAGQKKDYQDWSVVPADVTGDYACGDVERALKLCAYQVPRLHNEELNSVLNLESEVLRVLTAAELRGVRVDVERLLVDRVQLLEQQAGLEQNLETSLGASINPESADELADVVANMLGLPILHRTEPSERKPYGSPRFDDAALLDYIARYPDYARIFWLIRKVRRLEHLRTSFIEPYLSHHVDGVIHGNFNQNAAKTGRMTANDPNLQQVSTSKEWECEVLNETWTAPGARQYFVPRDGYLLTAWDYSQIEYRLFAHYSNSNRLIEAYKNDPNLDMHQWATETVLQNRLTRRATKNVNFGIIYGMGKDKMVRAMQAAGATMTNAECGQTLQFYYAEVPELKELQRSVGDALKRRGYIKTLLGRRRRVSPNWRTAKKGAPRDRGLLPYQALNAACQGSATEILKTAMVAAYKVNFLPLAPIHDELLFELPVELFDDYARQLRPVLERFVDAEGVDRLRVPIYVNCKSAATNWAEARETDVR